MDDIIVLDYSNGKVYIYTLPRLQMYDSEIEDWLEQNIDEIIESSRKISNIFTLETARLIKAALVNNKHSEKPVSELEVLQKMAKEREKSIVLLHKCRSSGLSSFRV